MGTFSCLCVVVVVVLLLGPTSVIAFQGGRGRIKGILSAARLSNSIKRKETTMALTSPVVIQAATAKLLVRNATPTLVQSLRSVPLKVLVAHLGVVVVIAFLISRLFPTLLTMLVEKFQNITKRSSRSSSTAGKCVVLRLASQQLNSYFFPFLFLSLTLSLFPSFSLFPLIVPQNRMESSQSRLTSINSNFYQFHNIDNDSC